MKLYMLDFSLKTGDFVVDFISLMVYFDKLKREIKRFAFGITC